MNVPRFGSILVLIGGILAILFSGVRIIFTFLLRRAFRGSVTRSTIWQGAGQSAFSLARMGRPFFGFLAIGAIIGVALGVIAIYAYTRVKSGKVKNGGLIAIIIGIVMIVTTQWIIGVITLVGGILCYMSSQTKPLPHPPQSPPP